MINILNVFKVKSKYSMALFRCIYCWPGPQSAYQYSVSTFNFKKAFVNSVRKTSHNVLKNQKSKYLYRNKRCKAYFIERFIITPKWNKLWQYFSSKFALPIPSVLSCRPVIWYAYHRYFTEVFLLYETENLFISLKQFTTQ